VKNAPKNLDDARDQANLYIKSSVILVTVSGVPCHLSKGPCWGPQSIVSGERLGHLVFLTAGEDWPCRTEGRAAENWPGNVREGACSSTGHPPRARHSPRQWRARHRPGSPHDRLLTEGGNSEIRVG